MTEPTDGAAALRIDGLALPGGEIGMCHCPGRNHVAGDGRVWARDLAADLAAIRDWGAQTLVSLIEERELAGLGVADLGDRAQAAGLTWCHLPITDRAPPDGRFARAWRRHGGHIDGVLTQGGRLVLHCAGGLGRTGTLAARLLIDRGVPAVEAIERVRAARPGAIETAPQQAYLLGYKHG